MMDLHAGTGEVTTPQGNLGAASLPADVVWLDLVSPSPDETAFVERTTGLRVPSLAELSEIEVSSRLRAERGVLYLSSPLVYRTASDAPETTPVGFVLSGERLITIRFEQLPAFGSVKAPIGSSVEAFAALVEAIIDRIADVLERIAAELDGLSQRLFRSGPADKGNNHRPAREAADLRVILRRVGAGGDHVSKIRDGLLGLSRIVPFVASLGTDCVPEAMKPRFETMRHDLASLSDYNAHLDGKVQLLLDATLGLINVAQNDIIKVLTIVSVVGVPPTLVASMYGMNFKNIPEYNWDWGYPYVLALIAFSAIAPLIWFKWRGWF